MQIGDLPRARNPVDHGGALPLWGRFLVLVSIAILAGWLVLPPPGGAAGEADAEIAAAPPSGTGIITTSPPQPAAPVRATVAELPKAEPPKAYPDAAPPEPVSAEPVTFAEAEPADLPAYTGSTPAVAPSLPAEEPKNRKAAKTPEPEPVPLRTQVASASGVAGAPPVAPAVRPAGLVNLNAASLQELNSLRGAGLIGKAIVRGRPYRSVEDLVKKRIVNRSLYARIKDQVTVR